MNDILVAKSGVTIDASAERVWNALLDPVAVPHYMFGARLETTWAPGSRIAWSGMWQGRTFQDEGAVLEVVPMKKLVYTHTCAESLPRRVHVVTIWLTSDGDHTRVEVAQSCEADAAECADASEMWGTMLRRLRGYVEAQRRSESSAA